MAKLSPGQTWAGDQIADYQFIIEQADAKNPRTQNTVFSGRTCVAFWLYNEDRGPNATPPGDDKNPRTQAESSRFIKRGGHYVVDHYVYLRRRNLPSWGPKGWMNFWQKYGAPHAGSPPLSVGSHDGVNWGFWRGEPPWDAIYTCPIKFDSWQKWTFDFVNADPGPLTVKLNGKTVFSDPRFRVINNSDRNGDWCTVAHIYMERDKVVGDGVRVGPIWMYNEVQQLS